MLCSFPEEVYFLPPYFLVPGVHSDKGSHRTKKYDVLAHKMLNHQTHTSRNTFPLPLL